MDVFIRQDRFQTRINVRRKAQAPVERSISGYMLESGQRHRTQVLGAGMLYRRFHQSAPPALALQRLGNRHFMDMQVVAKAFCAEEALRVIVVINHHPTGR